MNIGYITQNTLKMNDDWGMENFQSLPGAIAGNFSWKIEDLVIIQSYFEITLW